MNRIVETKTTSWFQRIMNSFMGVLIGLGMFFCSFGLIWYNEARTNMADVAADSVAISADSVSTTAEGQMVAATGILQAAEPVGDPIALRPGNYLQLSREVEMYAWVEKSSSSTKTNTGGSETTTTEYTYEKQWTSNPANSDSFKEPSGHRNPSDMPFEDETFSATAATIGAYGLDLSQLALPSADSVSLTNDNVLAETGFTRDGNYLFQGSGSLNTPQVGDVRISYSAVPSGLNATVFGQQEGNRVVPYWHNGDEILYRAYEGNRADGLAAMETAYRTSLWLLRGGALLMMWIGLTMVLGPISTFLDILPFLGRMSRGLIGIITFGVAFVLWLVATVLSALLNSIWGVILAIVILAGVGAYFYMKRPKEKLATN